MSFVANMALSAALETMRLMNEKAELERKLQAIRDVLSGKVTTSAATIEEAILRILDEPSPHLGWGPGGRGAMSVYIHDACPKELIGRRAELLWTDIDMSGGPGFGEEFAVVRLLDGDAPSWNEPDDYVVVCTEWGPRPPGPPPPPPRPDDRMCRWRPRARQERDEA